MRLVTRYLAPVIWACFTATAVCAQPYQILADLKADTGSPRAKLLLASNGYLYGTTSAGGDFGDGSVFRVLPNGTGFQTVHSFHFADGAYPAAELIEFGGSLYGTTVGAGIGSNYGTIFRVDFDGSFALVHAFSDPANGSGPAAALLESNGVLYGTTQEGGLY